ncbi:MAG: hypothetical protein JWQ39_2548 [Glaciihabitans sp.]|nr:hypothetical protein [Glaciihabitans sp.]
MELSRKASAIVIGLAIALVILPSPAVAFGFWRGTGAGTGAGSTGTLQAPTDVQVPTSSAGTVNVSWTASSGPTTPTGYYVTRASGSIVSAACGSSPTAPITVATCVDAVASDGSYVYTVVAIYRSWTAASDASGTVIVAAASQLAFTTNPTDSVVNVAITPAIEVAVESASGSPVRASGIAITLAIGANPASGLLAGTTTASTDASGIATFAGVSIDVVASGYTLTATSPGVAGCISGAFAIRKPPLAAPPLGSAISYSVLGTAATNGGVTTIRGDLGTYPAATAAGFPPGTVRGVTHTGDAAAAAAEIDLSAAYSDALGRAADTEFAGDVNGVTFAPGVHHTDAALALSAGGVLTLDASGDPNAVFIFQVNGALNTAAGSSVSLVNGAQAANVFWQVNGAAGTGASSTFSGTILAAGAITLGAGSELVGRALSSGAVTLANNTIR